VFYFSRLQNKALQIGLLGMGNVLQLEKVAAKGTEYFRQDKIFLVRKDIQLPENQQFFFGDVVSSGLFSVFNFLF